MPLILCRNPQRISFTTLDERVDTREDVKTDGSVIGDISTARISIEDGAQFKGRIEIDPTKSQSVSA